MMGSGQARRIIFLLTGWYQTVMRIIPSKATRPNRPNLAREVVA